MRGLPEQRSMMIWHSIWRSASTAKSFKYECLEIQWSACYEKSESFLVVLSFSNTSTYPSPAIVVGCKDVENTFSHASRYNERSERQDMSTTPRRTSDNILLIPGKHPTSVNHPEHFLCYTPLPLIVDICKRSWKWIVVKLVPASNLSTRSAWYSRIPRIRCGPSTNICTGKTKRRTP